MCGRGAINRGMRRWDEAQVQRKEGQEGRRERERVGGKGIRTGKAAGWVAKMGTGSGGAEEGERHEERVEEFRAFQGRDSAELRRGWEGEDGERRGTVE